MATSRPPPSQKLNPLAVAKGQRFLCELTGKQASIIVYFFGVPYYYYDRTTLELDWNGIKSKIAQMLVPLRQPPSVFPTVEEREKQEASVRKSKLALIELCRMEATKVKQGEKEGGEEGFTVPRAWRFRALDPGSSSGSAILAGHLWIRKDRAGKEHRHEPERGEGEQGEEREGGARGRGRGGGEAEAEEEERQRRRRRRGRRGGGGEAEAEAEGAGEGRRERGRGEGELGEGRVESFSSPKLLIRFRAICCLLRQILGSEGQPVPPILSNLDP
eukprot:763699-Hanusia_phi.AAC.1